MADCQDLFKWQRLETPNPENSIHDLQRSFGPGAHGKPQVRLALSEEPLEGIWDILSAAGRLLLEETRGAKQLRFGL